MTKNKYVNKYSKILPSIEVSSIEGVVIAISHQWKLLEKLAGKSPKEGLNEIGISVPPDVTDEWSCFNFLSLCQVENKSCVKQKDSNKHPGR